MAVGALLGLVIIIFAYVAWKPVKPPALPPDLAKVPSDAVSLTSVRIADLWNSDLISSLFQTELIKSVRRELEKKFGLPINQVERLFEKKFGLPINQVERLTSAVLNANRPAESLFFVGTTKPYDRDKVIAAARKARKRSTRAKPFM